LDSVFKDQLVLSFLVDSTVIIARRQSPCQLPSLLFEFTVFSLEIEY